jgi:hypothetical protein
MIGVRPSPDLGDFFTAAECLEQSFDRSGVVVSTEERRKNDGNATIFYDF